MFSIILNKFIDGIYGREMEFRNSISKGGRKSEGGFNEIVKIYFIIGMFLINAKPIFCSEKVFLLATNKFSYLLICNPLCSGSSRV